VSTVDMKREMMMEVKVQENPRRCIPIWLYHLSWWALSRPMKCPTFAAKFSLSPPRFHAKTEPSRLDNVLTLFTTLSYLNRSQSTFY
jgi:hypothetical protein